jgi:hypothetical protein
MVYKIELFKMSKKVCGDCIGGFVRRIPCLVAWSFLLILSTIYFIYLCPWIKKEICSIIPIIQGLIFIFVINNFLLATYTDPGRYQRAPPDEIDDTETSFHKIGLKFF